MNIKPGDIIVLKEDAFNKLNTDYYSFFAGLCRDQKYVVEKIVEGSNYPIYVNHPNYPDNPHYMEFAEDEVEFYRNKNCKFMDKKQ